jgi:membrane protein DedA with SNARE-associated domain
VSQLVGDVAQWVTEVVYFFNYHGVFILMALSNMYLPIPSQLVLPLSGFLVGQGRFSFPLVILASTAGSVVGTLMLYAPGRWLGEKPLRQFFKRYGRFVLLDESSLEKASGWYERHGGEAVLIARLVPGVGSLISVPAGIERMPLGRFVVYTALGNGFYSMVLVGLGWWLGSQWELVEQYVPFAEYAVMAAVAIVIVRFVWRRWKAHNN